MKKIKIVIGIKFEIVKLAIGLITYLLEYNNILLLLLLHCCRRRHLIRNNGICLYE